MQRYKKYTLKMKNNAECKCKLCVDACTLHLSCQFMNMELILQAKPWSEGMHRSAYMFMYEFV